MKLSCAILSAFVVVASVLLLAAAPTEQWASPDCAVVCDDKLQITEPAQRAAPPERKARWDRCYAICTGLGQR